MPHQKMIPPLPESNESPQERFKRYTKAILSVPKTEVETPEQAIARLKAEKRKIERMIAALNKKRKEKRNAVAHPSAQK